MYINIEIVDISLYQRYDVDISYINIIVDIILYQHMNNINVDVYVYQHLFLLIYFYISSMMLISLTST